jgi:hypothetical protein
MIKDITNTQFGRRANHAPAKMAIARMTVPAGGGGLTQTEEVTIEGAIRAITVGINNMTNAVTATISIVDNDGAVLFSKAGFVENTASAPTVVKIMNDAGEDLAMDILCAGKITVTCLMSGDPGTTTGLIDVKLYLE